MILYDESANANKNPQGLIQKAWVAYKGNTSWPVPGDTKNYLKMVIIANSILKWYAKDSHVRWDSLFTTRTTGPVTADNQAYDIDDDIFYLSDWVYINRTDGNTDRFKVVHPEARNESFSAIGTIASDNGDPLVYLTGSSQDTGSNLTINFETPWANMSAADIGGTVEFGCYVLPSDMVNPNDVVPVNDPEWMVQRLAAELARNDPAKQDQYPYLVGVANDLYGKMQLANQGNSYQQPNGPTYVLPNIGATWQQW